MISSGLGRMVIGTALVVVASWPDAWRPVVWIAGAGLWVWGFRARLYPGG